MRHAGPPHIPPLVRQQVAYGADPIWPFVAPHSPAIRAYGRRTAAATIVAAADIAQCPARWLTTARRTAERATQAGLTPAAKVAGPSNIGNYLAGPGIPATTGFGVGYEGPHGTGERTRLDSIPAAQAAYHQALLTLLRGD